jgi:hypothetical protein
VKIVKRGIRITDVPGVEYIETVPANLPEPDYDNIVIKFHDHGYPVNYGPAELGELIQALTEARNSFGAGQNDSGPWAHLKDVPAHVTAVWDRDHDKIQRSDRYGTGWAEDNIDNYSDRYGPFTASPSA